jgi:hypothetical protein
MRIHKKDVWAGGTLEGTFIFGENNHNRGYISSGNPVYVYGIHPVNPVYNAFFPGIAC